MNKKKIPLKLVTASGKGGVGKTMLSSSLAILFSQNNYRVVAVDCDVDAPNMAIWLNEFKKWDRIKKISTSEKPVIDYKKCVGCGLCVENCQFNALKMENGKPVLNDFTCEGCGACEILCPQKAIKLKSVKNGEIKIKKTKYGFRLITGQLYPGETGSGKIVSEIKKQAEKLVHNIMILDSSPGTGCPVIATLQDANFVILITEPTPSGLSDLKRVLTVVNYFKIPYQIVINKWNINKKLTEEIEKRFKGKILGKISFDKNIFKAISNLTPIMETNLKAKDEIKIIYENLLKIL